MILSLDWASQLQHPHHMMMISRFHASLTINLIKAGFFFYVNKRSPDITLILVALKGVDLGYPKISPSFNFF
jgi:hypothetical protein